MTDVVTPAPRFTLGDTEDAVNYRAVCRPALWALALGLLSPMALIHPLLWFVPPAAAVLALYALRLLAVQKAELIGRGAALVGLWLAILFGVWAPVRHFSREARLYSEARAHADTWFELVRQGRLYEAYELHLPDSRRQPPDRALAEVYGPDLSTDSKPDTHGHEHPESLRPEPKVEFRKFYEGPILKELLKAGPEGRVVFRAGEGQICRPDVFSDDVALRYLVRFTKDDKVNEMTLRITLSRFVDQKERKAHWHVSAVDELDADGLPVSPR